MENQKQTLTKKQRKFLRVGVVILLALFLAGFFLFQKLNTSKQEEPKLKNTTVYLQDNKLQVFDDSYSVNVPYPDKINVHYPYLLIIKPTQQITYIYNLDQKKKGKEVKEIILDYSGNNQLLTKGKTTFLDNKDLGVLCEKGFITSSSQVLCITKNAKPEQYKIISINPESKKQKEVYTSLGIITDVKMIGNQIYYGEITLENNKSYLHIANSKFEVPNLINLIYEMKQKPYFASFKSELNQNTENYYLIEDNKATLQEGKIYFYK